MSTKPTVSSNIDTDSQNPHSACDVSSVGVEELKNLLNQLEILSGVPQSLTFPERQDEIWKLCTHIALYEKTFFDDIRILFLNLGGPESLDEVEDFLFNLFNDEDIIRLPNVLKALQRKRFFFFFLLG
jgi:hypothetical protein